MVFQGGCQVQAREILVGNLGSHSLGGSMDFPKVLSNYMLLALSLSDLERLSFCRFWCMSLVEVDHDLRFGVSLG